MRSFGESNTQCSAIVSSTTPRFGPRWPLVLVTVSIRASRISLARIASCSWLRRFRSSGPAIDSNRVTLVRSSCSGRPDSGWPASPRTGELGPAGRQDVLWKCVERLPIPRSIPRSSAERDGLLPRRRYEAHIGHFEPEADDPLYEAGQGPLVWQFGAKGCGLRAHGDLAVVEFRAHRGACLTRESDFVCS